MNHYWRHVNGRPVISREGRAYRKKVRAAVAATGIRALEGRLGMCITAFAPDRRRRDLDNTLKAPLDALQDAGLYPNDGNIDDLRVIRGTPSKKHPRLEVTVWQIYDPPPPETQCR